jgi:predicted DCC family thiol-disulfide oxidoreductase YuxK
MHPILLYDGVCGLCNGLVQSVLRRDRKASFRFAALQSELATRLLARHGVKADNLDTVYVVVNPDQPGDSLLARSDAVLYVLGQLGTVWRATAFALAVLPRFLRDWGYNFVARHRYRIFGRYDTCPIPSPETRSRFLDT